MSRSQVLHDPLRSLTPLENQMKTESLSHRVSAIPNHYAEAFTQLRNYHGGHPLPTLGLEKMYCCRSPLLVKAGLLLSTLG